MESKLLYEEEKKLPAPHPRLTMKFLHILIKDNQLQDQILLQRVEQLEQRMSEIYQTQDEIAAADEQLRIQEESLMKEIQAQEIRTTRAKRHATPRRKSIWFWK